METSQSPVSTRVNLTKLFLPLANEHIEAGFPSPADDYLDVGIDLNESLIRHPASTFFLTVKGESMTNAGVLSGDLLIVDRSLEAQPGCIVVAILDGSFTLKKLVRRKGILYLEAAHPHYQSINLQHYENVQIWGVAIYAIHKLNRIV